MMPNEEKTNQLAKVAVNGNELLEQIGGLRDPYTCSVVVAMALLWLLTAMPIMAPAFISPFEKKPNDTPFFTVQDEFNLTNSLMNPAEWTGSMIFVGNLVAGQFIAIGADYYGRRHVVALSALISGFTGIASAFAPNFALLLFARFLTGVFFTAAFVTNYVLGAECLPLNSHSACTLLFGMTWVTGYCLTSPMALLFPNWRHLLLAVSIPCVFFGIVLVIALPESLSYSLVKKNRAQVQAYINNVERFSKKRLNYNLEEILAAEGTSEERKLKPIIKELFHSRLLINVLLCSYLWTATYFVYNGMSFASTGLEVSNNHLQFVLSGLVEIPSYFITPYSLDRLGRRLTVVIFTALGATLHLCMWIMTILKLETTIYFMMLWLPAKLSTSGVFLCLFIYGTEIFPVSCRAVALGLCGTVSNFGAIAAPHAPIMERILPGGTYLVFCLFFAIGSLTSSFLPETKNLH